MGAPRVLVISASIGSGHVAAGRALETALAAGGCTVRHVDLLDYTTAPFRRLYRQAYFDLVRTAPDLVDWLGKRLDRRPGEGRDLESRLRSRLARLVSYHLPRQIAHTVPDVVVHTHFLALAILSTRVREVQVPHVQVITDYWIHRLFMQAFVRRYYVANEEVAVHLRATGVEAGRVLVTGIPIDERFVAPPEQAEARARLELPPDRDLVLMMLGGLDLRTVQPLLTQLQTFRWPLTVVVVCGRSAGLEARVRDLVAEPDRDALTRFRVLGFTHEVPDYMAAADLMVGKPGGLTTAEALASRLPIAVVSPYPLQEEANANYLLEHGAGMRIDPLTTFSFKLHRFLSDRSRRTSMSAAAAALARPHAARDVVADLRESSWI